ncbi:hypothetical protein [Aeromonas salmonicida]|uniref:hypothetical protein n=1 Tax=Aeromonas salmonicida TaxID=645 RepID=UPI00285B47D7|nr:hypothetical protein [Aeromonas salmonicida]MDR7019582.1 hypothetical protein [Aeromonas salmonicida]
MKLKDSKLIAYTVVSVVISIALVICTYIINFHNKFISHDPADWGVLGDFFGGITNPIISLATLFFVAKTYVTQIAELDSARESVKRADELREISANAQISLAQTYIRQIELQNQTLQIQALSTSMNIHLKNIEIYLKEIERVTESMNNNRSFTSFQGKEYFSDEKQKAYRVNMGELIVKERQCIESYRQKIESLQTD